MEQKNAIVKPDYSKRGPKPRSFNALKNGAAVHRLIVGTLPSKLAKVQRYARQYRRDLEQCVVDAHGEVRSLHARAIRSEMKPKAVSPKAFQVAGLVMADVFTRSILKSGLPAWWEDRLELVVAEGPFCI